MVSCTSCGELVPAGKRFCGSCGQAITLHCALCGAENRAGVRFCEECGAPMAGAESIGQSAPLTTSPTAVPQTSAPAPRASAPTPQEERRLVTALFCDLVGFTPIAEQLDPEEVRDIQADYFDRMAEQIERYGGT